MELNNDGSMVGKTFSGETYKGGYPSPKEGHETYEEYYERVNNLKKIGFHLGDLTWRDYYTWCFGSPGGGGQYVQNHTIGRVPDNDWVWTSDEPEVSDEDCY